MKTAVLAVALVAPAACGAISQFEAAIDGLQANQGNGTGSPVTGTLVGEYDSVANTFAFSYELTGTLLGSPSAPGAHLHRAPAGSNGSIVFNFAGGPWPLANSHTWMNLSQANIDDLFAGNIYINFHTSAFPGGEVRGQIYLVPAPGAAALLGLAGLASVRRRR